MPKNIPKGTRSLYNTISEQNYSGCIRITDPVNKEISWELYCHYEHIYYVTSTIGQKERLKCLWKHFIPDFSPPSSIFSIGDYENITNWWQSKNLPLSNLKKLIFQLSEEALAQILIIDSPIIEFLPNQQILSPITQFSCQKILESAYIQSQKWKSLINQPINPFNRLYLDSTQTYQFYQLWKSNHTSLLDKKPRISFWLLNLSKKYCIYELAQERNILPLTFIEDFQNLLKANVINILPFSKVDFENNKDIVSSNKKFQESPKNHPVIACIDDSRTVQIHIQKTLEMIGYQTLSLTDPTLCLTALARYNPSLILMDINMPKINGYELCKVLKKSRKLRTIPIVMLTGREGIIDRMRAKRLGVEYYLTKPYNPQKLIEVVRNLALVKSDALLHHFPVDSS